MLIHIRCQIQNTGLVDIKMISSNMKQIQTMIIQAS